MMTEPKRVTPRNFRPIAPLPWNGSRNAAGQPVIKGVGEVQSAARMQDWRAKGSLYGDVPTSGQVAQQVADRNAADQVKRQDAFATGYENYKRKMGAGAPVAGQSVDLSTTERRRKNLIAGGAQPMEADAAIKQEQFAAQKAAMKPQAPAPATGVSLGADVAAKPAFDMPVAAPAAKPVSTIKDDGGNEVPMADWIKAKKSQANGDVPAMAKGGRKPAKGPILAGEEGNELKINDDETMEPIHGPQMIDGGKPGVIIPNKALKDLKKKFDKPIKGKKAAMGGRTSADGLIGSANAFGPAGIGGTTNVVMPSAPRPPQPVSFGNTFTTTEQPAAGYGPPQHRLGVDSI